MSKTIAAAGGLIWRPTRRGVEVAVIHRPHRRDWSLPKGKLGAGERAIAAALREATEETGLDVAAQQRLATVRYPVDGRAKTVEYWAMRHRGGEFVANPEADQLRWLRPGDAVRLLTFAADQELVATFAERPPPTSAVLLVRHARAGKRSSWTKDDQARPIDPLGRRQADALADLATLFAPDAVYSAPPARCLQTVTPLAARLGIEITTVPEFGDTGFEHRPRASVRALYRLTRQGVSVVSSQGRTIPGLLAAVDGPHDPHESKKGSVWAVFFTGKQTYQADYYERA